jgi:hypothetical protein
MYTLVIRAGGVSLYLIKKPFQNKLFGIKNPPIQFLEKKTRCLSCWIFLDGGVVKMLKVPDPFIHVFLGTRHIEYKAKVKP